MGVVWYGVCMCVCVCIWYGMVWYRLVYSVLLQCGSVELNQVVWYSIPEGLMDGMANGCSRSRRQRGIQ